MGLNNSSYKFFQEMLNGYQYGFDGSIEHGARCLMALDPENPFPENSQERELFYSIYLYYTRWNRGSVDAKINLRKLLAASKELCALVKENPYVYSEAEELEEKKAEEAKKAEQVVLEEPAHVMNARPESITSAIDEIYDEGSKINEHCGSIGGWTIPEPKEEKEEPKEEKKNWLKFLFPWRKEENSDDSSRSN